MEDLAITGESRAGDRAIAIGKCTVAEENAIAIGDFVHAKKGEAIIKAPVTIEYAHMIDLQIVCPLCSGWLRYDTDKFVHQDNLTCTFCDNNDTVQYSRQFENLDDFMKLKVECPDCKEWLVWRSQYGCRHVGECTNV